MQPGSDMVLEMALLYFIIPLWFLAGIMDWWCHRRTDIAHTAGIKESFLHLLMYGQVAVPLLACLFLEINALIIAVMIAAFFLHEATALWDTAYANRHRHISFIEQHVHSFLEMIPLMALLLVSILHWPQLFALVGAGPESADFSLRRKERPLPLAYLATVLTAAFLLELLPYLEETWRGWKAKREGQRASPR